MLRFSVLAILFAMGFSWSGLTTIGRRSRLSMSTGAFVKYQGLGNDFILVVSFDI
jgi:hypothetical protein